MTPSLRLCLVALVSALTVAACGSDASSSLTAPSLFGSSPGAIITGRVTGMSLPAARTTATAMASTRLAVTIVGTEISAAVDGSGRFTLTGVPPGDVKLQFSGSGIDATITLTGVSATDRISIVVSLNGTAAQVESERREDDDDEDDDGEDDDDIEGVVSNLSGTCPTLSFAVGGVVVKTNQATRFEDVLCARIADGSRVEVEGVRQIDGTILATEVERH